MGVSVNAMAADDAKLTKEAKAASRAQARIEKNYKGAENVNWSKTDKFQVAEFTLNGAPMAAFYRRNELIGTTQRVTDYTEIAPLALKNVITKYSGYKMDVVKLIGDETVYFFNLKNEKENFILKVEADNSLSFFKRLL